MWLSGQGCCRLDHRTQAFLAVPDPFNMVKVSTLSAGENELESSRDLTPTQDAGLSATLVAGTVLLGARLSWQGPTAKLPPLRSMLRRTCTTLRSVRHGRPVGYRLPVIRTPIGDAPEQVAAAMRF